jgi:hypothetical protein
MTGYTRISVIFTPNLTTVPLSSWMKLGFTLAKTRAKVKPLASSKGMGRFLAELYGARFPTEIYTRGCHWIPRMFA